MKKLFTLFTILFFFSFSHASDWVKITSDLPQNARIDLINSNVNSSILEFSLDGFYKNIVETDQGEAWQVFLKNSAPSLTESAPELPVFATSLIIPDKAAMEMQVISSEYLEYEDVLIIPSKGNLTRDIDPDDIDYVFGKYYGIDAFYPGNVGELSDPYIIRDYRGQALKINPFQYNPVTKVLRVYYHIELRVVENGESSYNSLDRTQAPEKIDGKFARLYDRHFLNYQSAGRYDPVEEDGDMLIISHADYMEEIQPLSDWKILTGMNCEVIDVDEIGGSADIKQYIQDAYDEGNLTFVLLVGDADKVPTSESMGNDSDVDYSYVAGDDHYPDLFVGRFSAETEDHVTTMVERTLEYEQDPIADTAWYTKAIGVGSNEGPGDDGEMDYEHLRNIGDNKLIPFTYSYTYEFFEGSQGGNDDDGNPNSSQVATAINSGATIINYTGHGSTSSWGTSGFNNGDINNLTNVGKWPFIISVACVNGNFVNATCFAETWTRASDNGEPTGAIATIMSTINQSWNPPMRGQDEMNSILTEAYEDNVKRTFGGIAMNGCMNMNDVYGQNGFQETDCWTIFGDPSLMVRTAIPAEMNVSHPSTIALGETSFTISCDAEGGIAALSMNGEVLGTAIVTSGSATIVFDPISGTGMADVVVTAFNYRPYISTAEVIAADGPYIVLTGATLNDQNGNSNGMIDYAESQVYLTIGLTNVGTELAEEVNSTITGNIDYISIENDLANYGDIAVGDTVYVTDGYEISVADSVPDLFGLEFTITSEDMQGNLWESLFQMEAHAPVLSFLEFSISDQEGNANNMIDPGETVDIHIVYMNEGSSDAYNLIGQLSSQDDYLTVISEEQVSGDILAGENGEMIFKVAAAMDSPEGHIAVLVLELMADHNITGGGNFSAIIGKKPVLVIDFVTNSKSVDSISACMDILQVNAEYSTQIPEDMNTFKSIFVLLGVYPENHQLTAEEGSQLAEYLQNGGCIYMEGGDTWFYDDSTDVHQFFNINGLSDGNGDLAEIVGVEDGFLSWFSFTYAGTNSYIDQIEPVNNAMLLLASESPEYGIAVSNDADDYKTVGSSFNFAGLVDHEGSSKDEMMAEILNFFEIGYIWTSTELIEFSVPEIAIYPNPFTQVVNIEVELTEKSDVRVDIFDMTGRLISNLDRNTYVSGKHNFVWNASDSENNRVDPGIYFVRVQMGDETITKKLILSK